MVSLVNDFSGDGRARKIPATRPLSHAEEAHIVAAVLVAFLIGGVALTLHGLAAASVWP